MQIKMKSMLGISFIEFIVFVGIIGGVVFGGLYYLGFIGPYAKANVILDKIRTVNSVVRGGGSPRSLNTETLETSLPSGTLLTPWGSKITFAGASSDSFTINIPMMPANICTIIMNNLSSDTHYDLSATDCPEDKNATVSFTYTYNINGD